MLSTPETLPPPPIENRIATPGLQLSMLAAIDGRRCDIAVIEASLLGARLEKCITDLGHNGRQAVTLVAADRKEAQRLIGFLSERRIHRLLIKPPAAGITRLLIESAANRCLQLRSAAVAA